MDQYATHHNKAEKKERQKYSKFSKSIQNLIQGTEELKYQKVAPNPYVCKTVVEV